MKGEVEATVTEEQAAPTGWPETPPPLKLAPWEPTDPGPMTWPMKVRLALAIAESHLTALLVRWDHHRMGLPNREGRYHGPDRRRNPRSCPLCGGPMRPDTRGPRDVRSPRGQIQRLPGDVLAWFSCNRCHRSQVGVPPVKLMNGWRPG